MSRLGLLLRLKLHYTGSYPFDPTEIFDVFAPLNYMKTGMLTAAQRCIEFLLEKVTGPCSDDCFACVSWVYFK